MNPVMLSENQSACVPPGVKRCLKNTERLPLELIEVQAGSYLEEGDLAHFADRYARA